MPTSPLPENCAIELDQIPAVIAPESQVQKETIKWLFVFHKCNNATGSLVAFGTSDTLGAMMEDVRTQYQEFLPKSSLRRLFGFFTKVIVEAARVDLPPEYDVESQDSLVQVEPRTNTKHDRFTEAFHTPEKFRDVAIQDERFLIVHSSIPTTPSSRTALSVRMVLNKNRVVWAVLIATIVCLALGVIAGVTSRNFMTAVGVSAALLGLLGMFLVLAAWLWKP